MGLYITDYDKCISFSKLSEDYYFLENLFLNGNASKENFSFRISERINNLILNRDLSKFSFNLIEKEYNNTKLFLSRNEIDNRLFFLIDLLNIINKQKYSVYYLNDIQQEIKDEFNNLKQSKKNIDDLSIETLKYLFNYGLLILDDGQIKLSKKGKYISFLI